MDEGFKELSNYIKEIENFKLPDYKDIPQIPLYMEQVIGYISEVLNPISNGESQPLTPFMVNNYVKAKMITPPVKKKYNTNHIGYLLSVSLLKNVVSMKDLATIIELDKSFTSDKEKLYDYFKDMHDEVLKNQAHRVKARLDAIERSAKRGRKGKSNQNEDTLNLAYIALRLYIESETSKMIADTIMDKLSGIYLSEQALKETKKEQKLEKKKLIKEANKIGSNRK